MEKSKNNKASVSPVVVEAPVDFQSLYEFVCEVSSSGGSVSLDGLSDDDFDEFVAEFLD